MSRFYRILLVVSLVCFATVGCKPAAVATPTPAPPTELPIGVYLPFSGGGSFQAEIAWKGLQVANKLRPTVAGMTVKLITCDERSDKAEGIACMSRLIEFEKVTAVIGTIFSSICIAAGEVSEKAGVVAISPTSTSPLSTQGRTYYFRACHVAADEAGAAGDYAVDILKANRAAVLYNLANDADVQKGLLFCQKWVGRGKNKADCQELTFRTGDQDFTSQLTVIKDFKPDMVFYSGEPGESVLAMQQAKSLGFNVPWVGDNSWGTPDFIKAGGAAVEGAVAPTFYHPDMSNTPENKAFAAAYLKEFNETASGTAGVAADCYGMIVEAIARAAAKGVDVAGAAAGKPEALKALREAIQTEVAAYKDYPGVAGPITMPASHNPPKGVVLLKVENGAFTYIATVTPKW